MVTLLVALMMVSVNNRAYASGRILFIDSPEIDKNYLAVINPDGTEKKRLTPAFNNIMFPRYSEKSGWIGFTNKTPEMESEIYLLNRAGDRVRRFITGAALEDFSPDGKFFLYTTTDSKAELYMYSIERKRASKISQNLKVTSASWSSCGEWIVVSAMTADGTLDIYTISTLAHGIHRITNTPGVNEAFPVFSNDKKYIVYFTNRYGSNEIEFMELETGETQRPLLTGIYPTLSPDNKWLAFQEANTIAVSQIDGLEHTTLVRGARFPSWIK